MVGWLGAVALALVGGLKGQGNPWRQVPLVSALAATALFISWKVRQSREKDTAKAASPDDKTVVNTRVYLVYDEEKKLECSTSLSQSRPTSSQIEADNLTDTDDPGSTLVEIENIAPNSENSQGHDFESENRTGGESLSRTVNVSKGDGECKDVEEISKSETTTSGVRTASSLSPACKITDISVSGFLTPEEKSQKFLILPEIPSIVGKGEPYVYELVNDSLKDVTKNALSYGIVADVTHQEKDIIRVMNSDVASNGPAEDDYLSVFVADGDSEQIMPSQVRRLEKVLNVVDCDSANALTRVENGNALYDDENRMGFVSDRSRESPPVHHVEGFASSHSPVLTHAMHVSGIRKEETGPDRESSTLPKVRPTWVPPEVHLNDWVSRRGDSEAEDGRLAHPGVAAESYPSPVAEFIPGTFPFSSYVSTASESCGSEVMDSKDEFCLHSSPNNVKRIISHVRDLEPDSRQSSEEDYAERLRVYDEYLADPSLSPSMRSQVLRAKSTLERLLYDSD